MQLLEGWKCPARMSMAVPERICRGLISRQLQMQDGSGTHLSCQPSSSFTLMSRSRSLRMVAGRGASVAEVRPCVLPFRSYCLAMGSAF